MKYFTAEWTRTNISQDVLNVSGQGNTYTNVHSETISKRMNFSRKSDKILLDKRIDLILKVKYNI